LLSPSKLTLAPTSSASTPCLDTTAVRGRATVKIPRAACHSRPEAGEGGRENVAVAYQQSWRQPGCRRSPVRSSQGIFRGIIVSIQYRSFSSCYIDCNLHVGHLPLPNLQAGNPFFSRCGIYCYTLFLCFPYSLFGEIVKEEGRMWQQQQLWWRRLGRRRSRTKSSQGSFWCTIIIMLIRFSISTGQIAATYNTRIDNTCKFCVVGETDFHFFVWPP
jgi:hypothetical protein